MIAALVRFHGNRMLDVMGGGVGGKSLEILRLQVDKPDTSRSYIIQNSLSYMDRSLPNLV